PEPPAAAGLLSEIRSSIRRQPFSEHYSVIPGTELGRGKFAVVRKCVEKCSGHEFAAKFMRKRRKGRDCRNEILHEIAVLELATPSSRVINLHQVYEMASEMVLVLEYDPSVAASPVCLFTRRLVETTLPIMLHSSKPDAEMVPPGSESWIRISWALINPGERPWGPCCGRGYVLRTPLKMRNITTKEGRWGHKHLIYTEAGSIGVLAYVMLTGLSPFLGEDKQETFLNISRLRLSYQEEELQQLEPAALSFIQMLLCKRPQDRATAEQCLQHPWLRAPERGLPGWDPEASATISSPEPPSSTSAAAAEEPEEPGAPGVEELIVMATYTLGQCRQSSSSSLETEALDGAKKPVSKCFKFEEPFSKLQEIPGEFIY
uniref:non-specific serine/threonine protein kinase n=1 Tax=Tetraodon nigroviridis TaxID=99883 RepID=H3DNP3_TETNG